MTTSNHPHEGGTFVVKPDNTVMPKSASDWLWAITAFTDSSGKVNWSVVATKHTLPDLQFHDKMPKFFWSVEIYPTGSGTFGVAGYKQVGGSGNRAPDIDEWMPTEEFPTIYEAAVWAEGFDAHLDAREMQEMYDSPWDRFCETGCGYKLPPEYAPHETVCGACLDNSDIDHDAAPAASAATTTPTVEARQVLEAFQMNFEPNDKVDAETLVAFVNDVIQKSQQ